MFAEIGRKFNENRDKSKATAYEQLQKDLMSNADTLILGEAVTLKELIATTQDLEEFMRAQTTTAMTPAQVLGKWLSGDISDEELIGKTEEE